MYSSIDNFRQHVKSYFPTMPHLHLAYLHVKLIADQPSEGTQSRSPRNLRSALDVVEILRSDPGPSPLIHHIAALAAITLAERLSVGIDNAILAEVTAALQTLREGLHSGQYRRLAGSKTGWDQSIIGFITKKLDTTQRLEGLADAAVGTSHVIDINRAENSAEGASSTDFPGPLERPTCGYLNYFE